MINKSNTVYVDGFSRGNPGPGGFKVVDSSRKLLFEYSSTIPFSNNIFEALGLAWCVQLYQKDPDIQIYTDSQVAIAWAHLRFSASILQKYKNNSSFEFIYNTFASISPQWIDAHIKKWDTKQFGQIPADPGNKH
jgi:ribonuclease HI